jgi:hypothetical protein
MGQVANGNSSHSVDTASPDFNKSPTTNKSFSILSSLENLALVVSHLKLFQFLHQALCSWPVKKEAPPGQDSHLLLPHWMTPSAAVLAFQKC